MPDHMQRFVDFESKMPDKRDADKRRDDFGEIYDAFSPDTAAVQSSRCEQCGIPYCQIHCPLQNNIPDWLRLNAEGRLQEAYEISQATNTFPEICGRICPQDRLCEGSCVLEQSRHTTITIGAIEKHITDTAWANGWVKGPSPRKERDQSVGIIGAGPAGLAAADKLRSMGYQAHIYDRHDRAGGLLIYGIPNFKLEKDIVTRRTQLLADSGVTFHQNFEVGRNASFAELRQKHSAVLIATGVYKARELQAPGSGLNGIHAALDFLITANRVGLGDTVEAFEDGTLNASGKNVVVIGGGDTAMDCVRSAIRQGAKSVKCLYRRNRRNMPGSLREVTNAEEEGVEFIWRAAPESFLGNSTVSGVRAHRMRLGQSDASGRQSPEPIEDSSFTLESEMVIKALGFDPEDLPTLFDETELPLSRWGTVEVDETTNMSALAGVFAAGDIVRGASLVVWGILDGRVAAEAIHNYIQSDVER
ncbi:MAG: NAD(P)-dependent oxidoreductase [Rhodospirillales bacterium]|jgi:glutamate synthase (NADPH) small chain|nr:NAD(P)-dependent oxidoreductase [Rhodospirillales bacterium]